MIKAVLRVVQARPTGSTDTDAEHQRYVDDAFTRAQKDLNLTEEQLRGYFKLFPGSTTQPDPNSSPSPQPSPSAGSGTSSPEDPCKASRDDRHYYEPLVSGTATGVVALLCPSDLKGKNSRARRPANMNPPGYVAKRDDDNLWTYARTHILGDRFNGKWRNENIFTGYRQMNDPGMKRCENKMASALEKKQRVIYSGQLVYGNGRGKIPTGINMTAISDTDGVLFKGVFVSNAPGSQVTC